MEAGKEPTNEARRDEAWHKIVRWVSRNSMVGIDNTTLALLFHAGAKPPNDPKTGQPLDHFNPWIQLKRWEGDGARGGEGVN